MELSKTNAGHHLPFKNKADMTVELLVPAQLLINAPNVAASVPDKCPNQGKA